VLTDLIKWVISALLLLNLTAVRPRLRAVSRHGKPGLPRQVRSQAGAWEREKRSEIIAESTVKRVWNPLCRNHSAAKRVWNPLYRNHSAV